MKIHIYTSAREEEIVNDVAPFQPGYRNEYHVIIDESVVEIYESKTDLPSSWPKANRKTVKSRGRLNAHQNLIHVHEIRLYTARQYEKHVKQHFLPDQAPPISPMEIAKFLEEDIADLLADGHPVPGSHPGLIMGTFYVDVDRPYYLVKEGGEGNLGEIVFKYPITYDYKEVYEAIAGYFGRAMPVRQSPLFAKQEVIPFSNKRNS